MMPWIDWLPPLAASLALLVIVATALSNARLFPRLQPEPLAGASYDYAKLAAVSVLIPARNERPVIAATVTSLLTQSYPNLRVTVLDDLSSDGTAEVAQAAATQVAAQAGALQTAGLNPRLHAGTGAAASAPSFQLLCGQPLPSGWTGKNWACHQLAADAEAQGVDILLFTDADVQWQPQAVAAVVAEFGRSRADLLTVWPTQTTISWGERLTVPLMALALLGYLPLQLAHNFPHPLAAAANGQCLAFDRRAYARVGGHAAVAGAVVEDVRLAQRVKAAGLRLRMADGNRLVGCRMYSGSRAAIDGYSKNILGGHGNHIPLLLLSTLFHWALFLWPSFWLLLGSGWALPGWPLWPALLLGAGVLARAVTAAATHQRAGDALLMPLSVLLMTGIALRAVWWRWRFGGVLWKGRILRDA